MKIKKKNLGQLVSSWFEKKISPKSFAKKIAVIALPIYLSAVLVVLINIIDSVMIAPLGTDKLASINAAAEINFFAVATISGMLQMGFIYFVQYHGKNKYSEETKCTLTVTAYWTLLWSCLLVLFVQFFADSFIRIFLTDETNIKLGAEYIKIISFSWISNAIVFTIIWALTRVGRASLIIWISIASLIVKIILNYFYINGIFVPKLEVQGVALATIIARGIEFLVAITILLIFRIQEFKGFLMPWHFSWEVSRKMWLKSILILNEALWSSSLIFQFWLTTRRGDDAAAVIGSAHVIIMVLFATHSSFSGAIGFFVGRSLGANRLKDAKIYAARLMRIVGFVAFIYSMIFASAAYGIVKMYNVTSSSTLDKATFELNLLFVILLLCFMNTSFSLEMVSVNVLWAGGKVLQGMIGDVLTNWIINAVGVLATYFTSIGYLSIYAVVSFSDFFKSFILYSLYLRYDWIQNLTLKNQNNTFEIMKNSINKLFRRKIWK